MSESCYINDHEISLPYDFSNVKNLWYFSVNANWHWWNFMIAQSQISLFLLSTNILHGTDYDRVACDKAHHIL